MRTESHWEFSQIWIELEKEIYTDRMENGGTFIALSPEETKTLINNLTLSLAYYNQTEQLALDHDIYMEREGNE